MDLIEGILITVIGGMLLSIIVFVFEKILSKIKNSRSNGIKHNKKRLERKNDAINNDERFKLNTSHIDFLIKFRESEYGIWENDINKIINNDIDKEIAFNELINFKYIKEGSVYSADKGAYYTINNDKKAEMLKILKDVMSAK